MGGHAGHGTSPARDAEGRLSTSPKRGVCDPNETVAFGTSSPEAPVGRGQSLDTCPSTAQRETELPKIILAVFKF